MVELRVTARGDGTTRYRVMADGGVSPSGVAWEQIVSTDDTEANRAPEGAMNEAAKELGYQFTAQPAAEEP